MRTIDLSSSSYNMHFDFPQATPISHFYSISILRAARWHSQSESEARYVTIKVKDKSAMHLPLPLQCLALSAGLSSLRPSMASALDGAAGHRQSRHRTKNSIPSHGRSERRGLKKSTELDFAEEGLEGDSGGDVLDSLVEADGIGPRAPTEEPTTNMPTTDVSVWRENH